MATTPTAPLNTFIIYARDDRAHKDQLLRHLYPLVLDGSLRVWHDGDIQPGGEWEKKLETELLQSQLVLVLVTVNSIFSQFIQNKELVIAMQRLRAGQAHIVPILVSPCAWQRHPLFKGLQGLPADFRPVEEWPNPHSAWTNIVTALADWADQQLGLKETATAPPTAPLPPAAVVKNEPPPAATPTAPAGFVLVKGGTFQMGDLFGDGNEKTTEKPHTVTVDDFYLAKHALTFAEYDAFCAATKRQKPSDAGWGRDLRPAINVSWYDAVEYCNWRSQQEGRTPVYEVDKSRKDPNNQLEEKYDAQKWLVTLYPKANGYRLPTEAEWEYAARVAPSPSGEGRGGTKVRFGNSRDVIDPSEINFNAKSDYKKPYSIVGEYRQKTVPVNALSANSLGLQQMSGNVWEWCWDWYSDKFYTESDGASNPRGPSGGAYRVLRGGGWGGNPQYCRAAYRLSNTPTSRYGNVGFRLASSFQ